MEGKPSLTIEGNPLLMRAYQNWVMDTTAPGDAFSLYQLEAATLPASFAIASATREKGSNPCSLCGFSHGFMYIQSFRLHAVTFLCGMR